MKRRDFLFLRTNRGVRTVEVSCERLYTQWLDTRTTGGDHEELGPWEDGEPPPEFDERSVERLFEELERDLRGADVLRVVERQWLSGASDDLRLGLGKVISTFRSRGGQVEFSQSESESS